MINIPVVYAVVAFIAGLLLGFAGYDSLQRAGRADETETGADEAETDRFLADLGVAYREDLARQIASQCDFIVRTVDASMDSPLTLATVDLKSLIYKVAVDVLSKE